MFWPTRGWSPEGLMASCCIVALWFELLCVLLRSSVCVGIRLRIFSLLRWWLLRRFFRNVRYSRMNRPKDKGVTRARDLLATLCLRRPSGALLILLLNNFCICLRTCVRGLVRIRCLRIRFWVARIERATRVVFQSILLGLQICDVDTSAWTANDNLPRPHCDCILLTQFFPSKPSVPRKQKPFWELPLTKLVM